MATWPSSTRKRVPTRSDPSSSIHRTISPLFVLVFEGEPKSRAHSHVAPVPQRTRLPVVQVSKPVGEVGSGVLIVLWFHLF